MVDFTSKSCSFVFLCLLVFDPKELFRDLWVPLEGHLLSWHVPFVTSCKVKLEKTTSLLKVN